MYKYTNSAYVQGMVDKGIFKIGTLYGYRNTEKHDTEIGDKTEGTAVGKSYVLSWTSGCPILKNEHAESFVQDGGIAIGSGQSISIEGGGSMTISSNEISMSNVGLSSTITVRDMYIFSLTTKFDEDVLKRFNYDACIEITDLEKFIHAISKEIDGKLIDAQAVTYAEREMHYEEAKRINAAFVKEPHYSYQLEFRVAWLPNNSSIEPIIIESAEAANYIKLAYPSED